MQKEFNLNEEQQVCIDSMDGTFVVLAGPGSGKTTVLIRRYLKMLMSGISFNDMLNLTFTSSAASEMASRTGILNAKSVFRTFHSFALDMLKQERHRLPFQTCDTIIPVELQDYQLMFDLAKTYPTIRWRTLLDRITEWKCSAVSPDQALLDTQHLGIEYFYAAAYRDYEIKCREQGWLDFTSLMNEAVLMLETNEEVRNKYKRKYISVDEAQDCDEVQFRLLQLIFDGNIFAVGDENQLIYEWRNAKSGNLTNFARVFPGAQVLFLGTNHRSTKNLVDFLIEILPVDNGLASHMTTYNEPGEPVIITKYLDEEHEVDQILKKIKDPEHSAILARTNRQLFIFQRMLAMRGIKYNFLGKKDFWDQNEIKKLLNLAKNYHRGNGSATVVLTDLIHQHNLLHAYSQIGVTNPMESSPVENLNSIVKMSVDKGSITDFLNYLRKLTHARKSSKALTLSTVHQAKGREWDYVYLVGANQDIMPHKDGEPAEENRIFFVACSRAAKELHISYYKSLSQYLKNYRDRIVDESEEKENGFPLYQ
ncbi:MAG: ATP-dependent helicase [Thaumarchaeota archaeon]|nr:ATP-dependent helicase [Nitrososphaerota archaeon]